MKTHLPFRIGDKTPLIIYPFDNIDLSKVILSHNIEHSLGKLELPEEPQYGIVFPWMNHKSLMLDFHIYHDIKGWEEGNPTITNYVVENTSAIEEDNVTCETSVIIMGNEGQYRRSVPSLEMYLRRRPMLGDELCDQKILK